MLNLAAAIEDKEDRFAQMEAWVAGSNFNDFTNPIALIAARVDLAKSTGDFQKEISSSIDLIHVCNYQGDYNRGDSLSFHYVTEAERVESPLIKAMIYFEAGKAAFFAQDYPMSISYDSSALGVIPLLNDARDRDSLQSRIMNYLGKAFNSTGQFVPAATTLAEAISLARTSEKDSTLLIELYTELGIVYSQIGLYDRAVEYLDRSTAIGTNLSPMNIASAHVNIGQNLLKAGDFPAARDRYLRALENLEAVREQTILQPYIYNGLVESHYRLGNRDSVNHYYELYAESLRENPEQANVNGFLYQQSTWLHHLVNGRTGAAAQVGQKLLNDARKTNDPADLILYTELMAATYRKQQNFQRADAMTQELMIRKDSIQSANRSNALLLYYNQFETKEKENEILKLNGERLRLDAERERVIARQRMFQTAAGLLALLLLTGGFFFLKLRVARQKLANQNDELSRLNATKDRFFGIIAHDLRNPIVALETADRQVGFLYDRGREDDVRKVVRSVSETAGRLSGLLDNLLQWALSQSDAISLKKERIPLAAGLADITDLYRPAATAKNISLKNTVDMEEQVFADHHALQTIFRNLIGNAVKYSKGPMPSTITLSHRREDGMDVISVSDQGEGLSEAVRNQMFQLHRKLGAAGRRASGTGLGLILCRDLAELHGGRISVESEEGKGATFSVWLPVF